MGVSIAPPGPPDDCAAAIALRNIVFRPDNVPKLPLEGCARDPCCACDYEAVLPPQKRAAAPSQIDLARAVLIAVVVVLIFFAIILMRP